MIWVINSVSMCDQNKVKDFHVMLKFSLKFYCFIVKYSKTRLTLSSVVLAKILKT